MREGLRESFPHDAFHHWYRNHGRHDLPWRRTRDPYRIYLSEIMLQQTRVETVLERFYFPFLERFPTLKAVAEAPEEAVLKAWEGLGYYSRARNLHATAKITGGELPATAEALERLPGIGRSTARAIACFAHGEALPILDANIRRILYRFFRRRRATEKELWRMAERLFDRERAYAWNQGMMDLGATVCTPTAPECDACPLRSACRGQKAPERYPAPRKKRALPVRSRKILLHRREGRFALQRAEGRFHGGLWHFPQWEGGWPGVPRGMVHQRYSHFQLKGELIQVERLPDAFSNDVSYFMRSEITDLPMGSIDRKVIELIDELGI